jgi:nitrile hydratase accessory protein
MMASVIESALANILRDTADRAFDAPWQAQAFALVMRLQESGHFTWDEWVRVFSRHVSLSPTKSGESVNDAYYRQWLAALEQIVIEKGILLPGDGERRTAQWRMAYTNTPHGQPVKLENAGNPPAHKHEPLQRGEPLVVSPASCQVV